MFLPGHIGVALLVFAPLSYGLVRTGRLRRASAGAAAAALLACAPDIDSRVAFLSHRGLTHTVWAALVLGLLVGLAWWLLAPPGTPDRDETAGFGFTLGTLIGVSHLLGDAITPMGIQPLAPATDLQVVVPVTTAADPAANLALLTAGTAVWLTAVGLGHRRRHPWARDPELSEPTATGRMDPVRVPVRDGRPVRRTDGGYDPGERRPSRSRSDGHGAD